MEKEMNCWFYIISTTTQRVYRILKIVFKFMPILILRPVRSFSPNGLFISKTLLEFGLMKFDKCFLKISKEAEQRISRWKKEFLKKLYLTLKSVMLSEFLAVCNLPLLGIKLNTEVICS